MSSQPENEIASGLMQFYTAQAQVMIAQYRNINSLLGRTTHHTHPGTLCEVLLRNYLRAVLPANYSADKGFIFGRADWNGISDHSPEIDILIHNEAVMRPLFRMDDFVIVHSRAVAGSIQVKTNFNGEELRSGLRNVMATNQHVVEMQRQSNPQRRIYHDARPFSALVAFDGQFSKSRLLKALEELQQEFLQFEQAGDAFSTSLAVCPDYVGGITGSIAIAAAAEGDQRLFRRYDSQVDGVNIAVQILVWRLCNQINREIDMPVAMPASTTTLSTIRIGRFKKR